jgi:hypothetical protein
MQRQHIGLARSIDRGRTHQLGNRILFGGTCRADAWQRHEQTEGSECDRRFRWFHPELLYGGRYG